MNFIFQIRNLQLLIFYRDCEEFLANLNYVFFYNIIKVNDFLYCFIILLHLISSFSLTFFLYLFHIAYVSIESIDCIFLSSFELNAILLISSVKTLCLSLLNFCCVFIFSKYFISLSS